MFDLLVYVYDHPHVNMYDSCLHLFDNQVVLDVLQYYYVLQKKMCHYPILKKKYLVQYYQI